MRPPGPTRTSAVVPPPPVHASVSGVSRVSEQHPSLPYIRSRAGKKNAPFVTPDRETRETR